jgi:single-strand DNA-binding protein
MAGSLNRVMLIGRLGKDPETKYLNSGQQVTTATLATDESYIKDGQKVDQTEWHRLNAWGKTAETMGRYLHKGALIYVEGKLQTRKWQDQQGQDRYTTEIRVFSFQFLESKSTTGGQGQSAPPPTAQPSHRVEQAPMEGDAPF